MDSLKRILVTGATGKQGGALIRALTSQPTPVFEIVALTRDITSQSAQRLARLPNVSLIQGDLDDPASIFRAATDSTSFASPQCPLYGVFSVQTPLHPKKEETQGKALVDAASRHGVKHFIYTSADRGGSLLSDTNRTPIPHFISKFNIEAHIKQLVAAAAVNTTTTTTEQALSTMTTTTTPTPPMQYTIIRPVAFMDNLTPNFFGRVFATALKFHGPTHKMQLVDTSSIGVLAAEAFTHPAAFANRSISFATDSVSFDEANAIFRRKFGRDLPTTYDFLGRVVLWAAWKELGIMFKWIREEGFGADLNEFRYLKGMNNFEEWLEKGSGFKG